MQLLECQELLLLLGQSQGLILLRGIVGLVLVGEKPRQILVAADLGLFNILLLLLWAEVLNFLLQFEHLFLTQLLGLRISHRVAAVVRLQVRF